MRLLKKSDLQQAVLVTSLEELPYLASPCALTIGNFDGVHLGHQAILNRSRELLPCDGIVAVVTFSNHPSQLFSPENQTQMIYPIEKKISLLQEHGADLILSLPFSQKIAELPFDVFLRNLHDHLHFSFLVLGTGSSFGKNREGDETKVKKLSEELGFTAEYLSKIKVGGIPVSSGRIRSLLTSSNFIEAADCLGRPL